MEWYVPEIHKDPLGFKDSAAGGDPSVVEGEVFLYAAALVPFSLIDADALSGVAGKASVGEVVRGVCENEVYRLVGDRIGDLNGIAVIKSDISRREMRLHHLVPNIVAPN